MTLWEMRKMQLCSWQEINLVFLGGDIFFSQKLDTKVTSLNLFRKLS